MELVLKMTKKKDRHVVNEKTILNHSELTVIADKGGNSVRFVYSNFPILAQPYPVNVPLLYIRKAGKYVEQSESSRLSYQKCTP